MGSHSRDYCRQCRFDFSSIRLLNPNITIDLLRLILAIGLIVLGFVLLVRGATSKILSTAGKLLNALLGVTVLVLGVAAIVMLTLGRRSWCSYLRSGSCSTR